MARSISPRRRRSHASPIATAEEEQAVEYVRFGPLRSYSMPIHAAGALVMPMRMEKGLHTLAAVPVEREISFVAGEGAPHAAADEDADALAVRGGEIEPRLADRLSRGQHGESDSHDPTCAAAAAGSAPAPRSARRPRCGAARRPDQDVSRRRMAERPAAALASASAQLLPRGERRPMPVIATRLMRRDPRRPAARRGSLRRADCGAAFCLAMRPSMYLHGLAERTEGNALRGQVDAELLLDEEKNLDHAEGVDAEGVEPLIRRQPGRDPACSAPPGFATVARASS